MNRTLYSITEDSGCSEIADSVDMAKYLESNPKIVSLQDFPEMTTYAAQVLGNYLSESPDIACVDASRKMVLDLLAKVGSTITNYRNLENVFHPMVARDMLILIAKLENFIDENNQREWGKLK